MVYALPLLLILVSAFEDWGGSTFGPALDYAYRAKDNARIVIFGDSSAMLGIDPARISDTLGLKTVNLPNTIGSLPVTGDAALRDYLAKNAPPQLIVFYFAPWNLDFSHQPKSPLIFEGEEMLFRHGTAAEIRSFVASHLQAALEFPFQFYRAVPKRDWVLGALRHEKRDAIVAASGGHMDYPGTGARQNSRCVFPDQYVNTSRYDTVARLAERYRTPKTKVLVYLSPIPACRNAQVLLTRSYRSVPAAPPRLVPTEQFMADEQYVHLATDSVPYTTQLFMDDVTKALRPSPQSD